MWFVEPTIATIWLFNRKRLMQRKEDVLESGVWGPSPGHVADLLCVPEELTAPLSSPTETGRG